MKLLAFAASSSSKSINKQLASYAASLVDGADVEILDINDYEMPIFSQDREEELGHPELAQKFFAKIGEADAIIISFAEHNGSYTAAYKNLFDWTSRIDMKVFQNKPMLLLATSPGPGGAASVLAAAAGSAPYFAAEVKATLSVPSFFDNFDMEKQVLRNSELEDKLKSALALL
ncbi:NAD(P)H-dependent oxidoreductase [Shewanella schlegeliana]|uniref:NAD(P)H-dependent oxidoreductase n=1 Tax=Shewanella schlegeliana TaxID=190308 RepID=A0ABS1T387_9GAMM|nr:NAD(P)H-dependent oxidoreductase [Shewanella schlegeliana]MBL4914282.1 NAD(P)H-dependent oxidoreductase [Shewanella schlegeliana]MCL1109495.1 NAD(P)H-dependent oxidoreductase [Shewanella schlegeliana]GIU33585.1 FMN reductase [Shewanella schlegeliana]